MEEKQEEIDEDSNGPWRACTGGAFESRLERLEVAIQELRSTGSGTQQELKKVGSNPVKKERKPISEYKAIQNAATHTEDKHKFREWNDKFVGAMGQVDPLYEKAIKHNKLIKLFLNKQL